MTAAGSKGLGAPTHIEADVLVIGAGGALPVPTRRQLKRFPESQYLNLLVDRRRRVGGIQQLLLTQTHRLNTFCRYLERRHKHVADCIGSPLT
jgi:hypothetical protein